MEKTWYRFTDNWDDVDGLGVEYSSRQYPCGCHGLVDITEVSHAEWTLTLSDKETVSGTIVTSDPYGRIELAEVIVDAAHDRECPELEV